MDIKELSKNMHLIIMPSSLWAVHVDPQLDVDKGIVITFNNASNTNDVYFFLQNLCVEIPSINNTISSISELSSLIYYMHNLRACQNAELTSAYPDCAKYVYLTQYATFCQSCVWNIKATVTKSGCLDNDQTKSSNCTNVDSPHRERSTDVIIKKYNCEMCAESFIEKSQVEQHLTMHKNAVCNNGSNDSDLLKQHIVIHPIESNVCSVCGRTFQQHCKLKEHLLIHSSETSFRCDICNKVFQKLYNLNLHKKIHSGSRPYVCSICGKTYTTQSNLCTHIRSTHTNKKPYVCSTCAMSFVHPRHLRIHMRKHTGEKPYKCLVCEKRFAKNIHLTVHTRTHTGDKPYICTFCGKGFTTTGNLTSHKKVHHKDVDSTET